MVIYYNYFRRTTMFKALAQRIARYVLRDELNILNNRVFQAECCESMALDLSEERALMCDKLRKELHEVKHDNASLVEIMHELRMEIDMLNGDSPYPF